jgi:hypothetical protein
VDKVTSQAGVCMLYLLKGVGMFNVEECAGKLVDSASFTELVFIV